MPERWLPVINYEGKYEISNRGNVKSLKRLDNIGRIVHGRILKQRLAGSTPTSKRYSVQLSRNGKLYDHYVHVLMLESFISLRPEGMVGCHIDDTPRNDLSNLKWDTPSGNILDEIRNGHHRNTQLTHCRRGGHELTDSNTYIQPSSGGRICRKCKQEYRRESYRRESKQKAAQ